MEENNVPGKGAAIASLVLGIVSIACWAIFGATLWANIVAVVCGVVGLILAINAKKAGFTGGLRTAGFVLSLIGLIGGAVCFVACVACVSLFKNAVENGDIDVSGLEDAVQDALEQSGNG